MSGGEYDYLYQKVEEMAQILQNSPRSDRKAFARLLFKISVALREIEWVDSGDSSEDADVKAIQDCISNHDMLRVLIIEAQNIKDELSSLLRKIKDKKK